MENNSSPPEEPYFRPHPDPSVEIILNTELAPERVAQALLSSTQPLHPKVQAMMAIFLAEAGLRSYDEANRLALEAYQKPSHVDLQIIFLAAWYSMLLTQKAVPFDQMYALESSMSALISPETPPEITAIVKFAQSHMNIVRKNYRLAAEHVQNLTEGVSERSPFYKKLLALQASNYYGLGMGTRVKSVLLLIEPHDFDYKGIILARIVDHALTGKLEELPELFEKASKFSNHKYMQLMRRVLDPLLRNILALRST